MRTTQIFTLKKGIGKTLRAGTVDTATLSMANVAITPANFQPSTRGLSAKVSGTSAEAFDTGDVLSLDTASNKLYKAQSDGSNARKNPVGFAGCSCPGDNLPCFYIPIDPDLDLGGTVVEGTPYFVSATAGKICPYDDLEAGDTVMYVGTARASNHLEAYVRNSESQITGFTVTYNGNGSTGGTAPVDGSSPYKLGRTVTVLDEGDLVKTSYVFDHWNTAANDSGTSYDPDDTFAIGAANVTLYAQWVPE